MYYQGLLIGALSFVIIGIFHPLVVKTEYYLGKGAWAIFLVFGILFVIIALLINSIFWSALSGLLGFTCMWTIKEMFEQEERVQKGWFPANPQRKGKIIVRQETPADYSSIRRINEQAFGQLDEAFLVEKLRKNPAFNPSLSLVAVKNNIVVGHVLFFPVKIISPLGKEVESLALAPLAVFPEFQKQGIGKALVNEGLRIARRSAFRSVFVLGHPNYYKAFGFIKASSYEINCPCKCPEGAFTAQELFEGALNGIKGTIQYPKEFNIFN